MTQRKHFPVFYIIYFSLIVLFLIGLLVALTIVRDYLEEFESAQPEYEAQRVFEKYYADGEYSDLMQMVSVSVSPLETPQSMLRYLNEFTSGKEITYTPITTGLDSTLKYIVKADDVKFSSFTLKKSESTTPKGFSLYTVDTFEVYSRGSESFTVTAPGSYSVYINGILLDEKYRTGKEKKDISCNYMPEGVSGTVFVDYSASELYYPPESVRIVSSDGRECPVERGENNYYSTGILYSETLMAEYSEYVISAAKAISAYMQNDGRFSSAAAYMDSSSELYVNLRTSETYFVISHSSYDFEDVRATEFCAYDDNTFSCRVAFTHVLKRKGSADYRDYIDMTLFLRRVGDKFLIYDRYNH